MKTLTKDSGDPGAAIKSVSTEERRTGRTRKPNIMEDTDSPSPQSEVHKVDPGYIEGHATFPEALNVKY